MQDHGDLEHRKTASKALKSTLITVPPQLDLAFEQFLTATDHIEHTSIQSDTETQKDTKNQQSVHTILIDQQKTAIEEEFIRITRLLDQMEDYRMHDGTPIIQELARHIIPSDQNNNISEWIRIQKHATIASIEPALLPEISHLEQIIEDVIDYIEFLHDTRNEIQQKARIEQAREGMEDILQELNNRLQSIVQKIQRK